MLNDLTKKASEIMGKYLRDEPIHGKPHIDQVHKYYKLLKKDFLGKEREDLLCALELSVLLHDIGNYLSREQHGAQSIKILKENHCEFLSKIPEPSKSWFIYAINYHSDPDCKHNMPPEKAMEGQDICLSLLMLLDHMDAIGKIGVCRAIMHMGNKYVRWIPNDKDFKKLKKPEFSHRKHPRECLKELLPFKDRSPLDHLSCNYCYIEINLDRVKEKVRLGGEFLEKYGKLSDEQNKYINLLKKNKKLDVKKLHSDLDKKSQERFKQLSDGF